jgi:hypothetical protein
MKQKFQLLSILTLLLVGILSFQFNRSSVIPKTWDMKRLHSMHLPLPDTSIKKNPVSEEYYYQLPERVAYKTYPFYMPGNEPKGYYEWLGKQEPEIIFNPADLKTDSDWIKAGEIIYDLPILYQVMDSAFQASLPDLEKHWRKGGFPITPEGALPFLSIVVREKGRIEMGLASCGYCHTKVMPDGNVLKGGQGNFQQRKFIAALLRMEFKKLPDSVARIQAKRVIDRAFTSPWIGHENQTRVQNMSVDDWLNNLDVSVGVMNRQGTSFGYPVSVPDLFNVKDRKYLDRTGQLSQQDIGDLMRYSALNQGIDLLHDYNGFTPAPRPADPKKSTIMRYTDEQLFALANYIYALKPPKNPTIYPRALLSRGEVIFKEEGCITCHTPPLYSNNKLTPVDDFVPPKEHFKKYNIFDISVGTDPVLALYTRKGTGYYKVPSLVGAWNRTAFLHGGNLANLEDLFDPKRLEPDYTPTGYMPPWLTQMAVPGHSFGMELNEKDKKALVAFIKSL